MSGTDDQLGERLQRERPLPAPGFRARLRATLLSSSDWPAPESRPSFSYRPLAFSYAAAGAACLLIAAIGVAGAGPFAA
jgi:hypothetical protein